MRALQFTKTGSLDELRLVSLETPRPAPGEVLVQVRAAAVNPSDIANVLGRMRETSLPRVPGRDFAGLIVDGCPERLGQRVFGSGQNLGFGRDGSHAEFLVVPGVAALPIPANLSFEQAASLGVAYLTAWKAVVTGARIEAGETILITGTTGAVGSAAARIAHQRGARVLGTVRKRVDIPHDLPVADWIVLETAELACAARELTSGQGVQAVLDVVGGALFEPCLQALAWRGRQVAIASNPNPVVSFNLRDFYHQELRLMGLDSLKIDFEETGAILGQLLVGIEAGHYRPGRLEVHPLERGPQVYLDRAAGRLRGKPVLIP